MINPLTGITELGQAVWFDDLSRDLITSGRLQTLIEIDGVSGISSNPTILQKAINTGRDYDHDGHHLVDSGLSVEGIYEGLAVSDIRAAADLLRPVYEKTSARDGYVSLEVSPSLAYDTAATVAHVKRLFQLADRENVMIKVPGTQQGLEAVPELIASGININITLIFSLEQYRSAADAYVQGIQELLTAGGDARHVASVVSFVISQVDTMLDEILEEVSDPASKSIARGLMGKAAISNAKMAYGMYKEIFHGIRFASLMEKGARPQRIVWASTSTKTSNYPDTYYVDSLIGPETVSTMRASTLEAYRDHGRPAARLEEGLEAASGVFSQLEELGIDMQLVMENLLENGVRSFVESFENLLSEIAVKRTRLLRGWGHRSASLGGLQQRVDECLAQCDKRKISETLWASDASLWTDDQATQVAIRDRLGWLHVVETMVGEKPRLRDFADEVRGAGFEHAVLLGMGGSSLAPEVFSSSFGSAEGFLDLRVLDTTVPGRILEVERSVNLEKTLFIVASKSGGTIEVLSLFKYFWAKMENLFENSAGERFIAITDPGTSLGKLASEHRFRKVFLNPSDIGGRFSALSYFGLVPAALIGVDLDRLLMRASQAVEAAGPEVPSLENGGLWLAAIMSEAAVSGVDKLSLIISPMLQSFGWWLEQLIAESTGKEGKGIIPIEGEPPADPENYGNDRFFVYLRIDDAGVYDHHVSALEKAGHPVTTFRLHGPYDLGREMFKWEFATANAGALLGINPFDEPNVKESKDNTKRILELYKRESKVPQGERVEIDAPDLPSMLNSFLSPARPGNYVAFNAFISPSQKNQEILQTLRVLVREKYRTATVVGFGPRFLHSTGQIHKGGPDKGFFIEITSEDAEDLPIPGEAFSFGVLKSAQSLGDYEALKSRGRRIIRVHLSSEADLEKLIGAFKAL